LALVSGGASALAVAVVAGTDAVADTKNSCGAGRADSTRGSSDHRERANGIRNANTVLAVAFVANIAARAAVSLEADRGLHTEVAVERGAGRA